MFWSLAGMSCMAGAVEGWAGVGINVPSFAHHVPLTRSHCLGAAFSIRNEKDLSRTAILFFFP